MKIGEVARAAGITSKTIRFYEDFGLLPDPGRTESGYRQYERDTVERLGFVVRAKQLGMSLEEIRGILDIHDRQEATCDHVRELLEQKIAAIDQAMADLKDLRADLQALADESGTMEDCRPSGGRVCGIIERVPISRPAKGRVSKEALP